MNKLVALAVLLATSHGLAADAPRPRPMSLRDCYLAALEKTNADMAYVAQKLCDAAFKAALPSLVIYSPQTKMCGEWWLDAHGRYETSELYCAFEARDETKYTLACQDKAKATRFSVVDLVDKGERYERASPVVGEDMGLVFKSLAACLRHKAGVP